MSGNEFAMAPATLAMAHDRAQAEAMKKLSEQVNKNHQTMRQNIYPWLHECAALIRASDKDKTHDLSTIFPHLNPEELKQKFNELNQNYQVYRSEFMESINDGAIHDGTIENLFPEDLNEVSLHELERVESKLKEWLESCKNDNDQKTQDLYLMIQIGVALLTAFQNMQKDVGDHTRFVVRNARGG